MTDLSKYPKIWCSNCMIVQPLICHEMNNDLSGSKTFSDHAAMDLSCRKCGLVIATLHAEAIS